MKKFAAGLVIIVGLINLGPIIGVMGQGALEKLYGISSVSPDVLLLLRHRAILLAIIGALLIGAVFWTSARGTATAAAYVSMMSYVILFVMADVESAALIKVYYVDVTALAVLTGAIFIERQHEKKLKLPQG